MEYAAVEMVEANFFSSSFFIPVKLLLAHFTKSKIFFFQKKTFLRNSKVLGLIRKNEKK
jgi:hypothetical protein